MELTGRAAVSAEIQAKAKAQMARIGITKIFLEQLVDEFYVRIKSHKTLGPVFNDHIGEHWTEHLDKMKQFWLSLAFKSGSYGGKPVQAHLHVNNITPELFPQWLQLFDSTLDDLAPSKEAHEWLYATAERIAKSLTLSLFYNPAIDAPITHKN